mgnify:CR=1 FL=1
MIKFCLPLLFFNHPLFFFPIFLHFHIYVMLIISPSLPLSLCMLIFNLRYKLEDDRRAAETSFGTFTVNIYCKLFFLKILADILRSFVLSIQRYIVNCEKRVEAPAYLRNRYRGRVTFDLTPIMRKESRNTASRYCEEKQAT